MDVERKLKKAKIHVMRANIPALRFWSPIMAVGTTTVDYENKIPTAYTNGRDEVYSAAFIDQLPTAQLSFVCLHEAVHKGLRHLTVWKKLFEEDRDLANRACDYVGNNIIVKADPQEAFVQFPRNPDGTRMGLYDPRFDGMSARQVFQILKQERDNPPPDKGQPRQGDGEGNGFDTHDWQSVEELPKEERDALEKEIDHALRRGEAEAKKCGASAGDIPAEVGEMLRPKIDWKQALQEFITQTCARKDDTSYRRLNRRFHAYDLIMPTSYGENVGHIVVGADLSASMWDGNPSPTQRVLSEIVGIAHMVKPDHIDLLYWDNHVAGHEEYKQGDHENIAQAMRPRGGGGTDPRCVEDYLKTNKIKPDCIIMLTDGETFGQWGSQWPAPILWVILNPKIIAGTGKTVHIDHNK